MKKILSIDIDFLFKDCPDYHKYIHTDLDYEKSWGMVDIAMDYRNFEPCMESLEFLLKVLRKKTNFETVFHTIEEHHEIIDVMHQLKCKDANVVNIDYHHDITYGNDAELSMENWVTHGRKLGLIGKYGWITQDDAEPCAATPIVHDMCSWKDLEIDTLPTFDLVVICISRHFTPIDYQEYIPDFFMNFVSQEEFREVLEGPVMAEEYSSWNYSEDEVEEIKHYTSNEIYVQAERDIEGWWLSIVNQGERQNFLSRCAVTLERFLNKYGSVRLCYEKNYKSEILIKRLIKNYETELYESDTHYKVLVKR